MASWTGQHPSPSLRVCPPFFPAPLSPAMYGHWAPRLPCFLRGESGCPPEAKEAVRATPHREKTRIPRLMHGKAHELTKNQATRTGLNASLTHKPECSELEGTSAVTLTHILPYVEPGSGTSGDSPRLPGAQQPWDPHLVRSPRRRSPLGPRRAAVSLLCHVGGERRALEPALPEERASRNLASPLPPRSRVGRSHKLCLSGWHPRGPWLPLFSVTVLHTPARSVSV